MMIADRNKFNNLSDLLTYKLVFDGLPSEPSNSCLQKTVDPNGFDGFFFNGINSSDIRVGQPRWRPAAQRASASKNRALCGRRTDQVREQRIVFGD